MDIGIDTIIYIVLGLIFVVAQATRKKKQQVANAGGSENNDDGSQGRPSKGLLEQFLGFDEEYESPVKPENQRDLPPQEFIPESPPEYFSESVSDWHSLNKRKEVREYQEINELSEDQKTRPKHGVRFDLRKAIIYSAILERKYF